MPDIGDSCKTGMIDPQRNERSLASFHLTALLHDGPLRRPQHRYTVLAGGSACPVAAAPSLPAARITLSPRGG